MKILLLSLLVIPGLLTAAEPIANPAIDYRGFRKFARDVEWKRQGRRLTEQQFAHMAAEPATVVLDARSADRYALRHVRGAVNLPFTDFTAIMVEANSLHGIYTCR